MNTATTVLLALVVLGSTPVEDGPAPIPGCERDIQADLLTIQDRLDTGRLDAARAYADDLLACPDGEREPGVHLAVAEIEQRLGRLNAAYRALSRAAQVAQEVDRPAVVEATAQFRSRWVAVELFPTQAPASDPLMEYAGLVADEATVLCLSELSIAVQTPYTHAGPTTLWLVPGDYRQGELHLRLPPGSQYTVKVATAAQGAP